jgi:hypothetical protein
MDYITAQQAADKWGVSLRWVQSYLTHGRINGAVRFGRAWMIPKDAEKPIDARVNNKRHIKTEAGGVSHAAKNTDN